jgi:hypothetical protein
LAIEFISHDKTRLLDLSQTTRRMQVVAAGWVIRKILNRDTRWIIVCRRSIILKMIRHCKVLERSRRWWKESADRYLIIKNIALIPCENCTRMVCTEKRKVKLERRNMCFAHRFFKMMRIYIYRLGFRLVATDLYCYN